MNELEPDVQILVFVDPPEALGGRLVAATRCLHPSITDATLVRHDTVPPTVPASADRLRVGEGDIHHLAPVIDAILNLDSHCNLGLAAAPGWSVHCRDERGHSFVVFRHNEQGVTLFISDEVVVPADLDRTGTPAAVVQPRPASARDWDGLVADLSRWAGGAP